MKTLNEIENKLNKVSVAPLTTEEKGRMWNKIEAGIKMPQKSPYWSGVISGFSVVRMKTGVAVALLIAVLFGGTGATFAYADELKPGDALFPVSLLKEKIVLSFTPTEKQGEVRLKFAEKRIEQGKEFFNTLNTTVLTATSTRALGDTIASSTNGIIHTETKKATSSPVMVKDAVDHISATVAYLQGIRADMIARGDTKGAETIQIAINKIVEQMNVAGNQNAVVLAKVQEHKNQFNVVVSTKNASSTTVTKFDLNTKKDEGKLTITEKENKPVIKIEERKEEKKAEKVEKKEDREEKKDNRGQEKKEEREEKDNTFFGWLNFEKKTTVCHNNETLSVSNSAVKAHVKHGDKVGTCVVPPVATTTPVVVDTTAPVLTDITFATSTNTLSWKTNENATGKIYYGKTAGITTANASFTAQNSAYTTDHSFTLSGLSTSTTYYFLLEGKDTAGNTTVSEQKTFTTGA